MKSKTSEPSAEYLSALTVSNEASRAFSRVQWDYRNRVIGDAEYLAGRAIHDKAQSVFDAALLAELAREGNA